MAVGRHLECLIPRSSYCNLQKLSHSVPELGGPRHILFLFHKKWRFYEWNNYSKWLPDAILNVFVPVTVTDPGKLVHTHCEPFYVAFFQISFSLSDILWLLENTINDCGHRTPSWILFLKVVREIFKNWVIPDLNWEVFAKFHLCFMRNEDFMNEINIQNGYRTPSWISLSVQQLQILASTRTL